MAISLWVSKLLDSVRSSRSSVVFQRMTLDMTRNSCPFGLKCHRYSMPKRLWRAILVCWKSCGGEGYTRGQETCPAHDSKQNKAKVQWQPRHPTPPAQGRDWRGINLRV